MNPIELFLRMLRYMQTCTERRQLPERTARVQALEALDPPITRNAQRAS